MTTIMVATVTIYVNTTVIMIMTMTMKGTTTMIMTVVATTIMTKIFKQVQQDNFYCLLKMIKKATKIQFALPL